jgi:hypothetical protein
MFFVVHYRSLNRRIDRLSRYTRQFSGPDARDRMNAELQETRELLAGSREQAAQPGRALPVRWPCLFGRGRHPVR